MANSTDTYYYFSDGLGNVRNIIDSSETVQNTYDYRAFGVNHGNSQNATSPYRTPRRVNFTARFRQAGEVSLPPTRCPDRRHEVPRNRYYFPTLGIFASRDAMWADIHRGWGYVGNSPTMFVDPWGLFDHRMEYELRKHQRGNSPPDLGNKYPDENSWELMQSIFGTMYGLNPSRLDAIEFSVKWEERWGDKARCATRNGWNWRCAENWLGHDTMGSREGQKGWYLYVDPCTGTEMWVRKGSETEDQLKFREKYIACNPPEEEADECPTGDGDDSGDGPPNHPYRDHSWR